MKRLTFYEIRYNLENDGGIIFFKLLGDTEVHRTEPLDGRRLTACASVLFGSDVYFDNGKFFRFFGRQ
jgi:hypothetical protein